jgi:hypothetical protein
MSKPYFKIPRVGLFVCLHLCFCACACVRVCTLKSWQCYRQDYRVKGIAKHRCWKQWKPTEHRKQEIKRAKNASRHSTNPHTTCPKLEGPQKTNPYYSEVTKRDPAVKLCIRVPFFQRSACKNEVLSASASR